MASRRGHSTAAGALGATELPLNLADAAAANARYEAAASRMSEQKSATGEWFANTALKAIRLRLFDPFVQRVVSPATRIIEDLLSPPADEPRSRKSSLRTRAEQWWYRNRGWIVRYTLLLVLLFGLWAWFHTTYVVDRSRPAEAAAIDRVRALRVLLETPAREVSTDELTAGFLRTGERVDDVEARLKATVAEMRASEGDGVWCATAKHLNLSCDVLALLYTANAAPLVMWNVRLYRATDDDARDQQVEPPPHPVSMLEASDFYDALPPVPVTRSSAGWVEYIEVIWSGGSIKRRKPLLSGLPYRCVAHAHEILTGDHAALIEHQLQELARTRKQVAAVVSSVVTE